MSEPAPDMTQPAAAQTHDCWNRIGVRGDRSCSELAVHAHCRNCPVYSTAASSRLDTPSSPDHVQAWTSHFAQALPAREAVAHAAVVFRVGEEWLALPAHACMEITEMRPIHTVPHRRNGTLLGLVNIRGTLLPCASVAALLNLNPESEARAGSDRAHLKRLVVLSGPSGAVAVRADEVEGVHRFPSNDVKAAPATVTKAKVTYTKGVARHRDNTVALLDHELLYAGIGRSLA